MLANFKEFNTSRIKVEKELSSQVYTCKIIADDKVFIESFLIRD